MGAHFYGSMWWIMGAYHTTDLQSAYEPDLWPTFSVCPGLSVQLFEHYFWVPINWWPIQLCVFQEKDRVGKAWKRHERRDVYTCSNKMRKYKE